MTSIPSDPTHPFNRYPWQHPNSTARRNINDFLDISEGHIGRQPEELPASFTPEQGRAVLRWPRDRLDVPAPASLPQDKQT